MVRRYRSTLGMLVTGLLVIAGCDTGNSGNTCVSDVECTTPGEICLVASSTCGCEPVAVGSGGTDTCTEADANTICHPDRGACEAKCTTNNDCLAAGEICDTQTSACRAAPGCSSPGNECASTQVCDPATDRCIDPCTSTSCTSNEVCNDQTKLCVPDCTVTGNECTSGKTCDAATKVCVDSCGAGSCQVDEACGPAGDCIKRCDAATDPTVCTGANVCDVATGLCDPGCDDPNTNIVCDAITEVCNIGTGLCIEKCTGNIDCAGGAGFCDLTTGICDPKTDITECNEEGQPASPRQYVDPATNMCTSTSALAQCARASSRDEGNKEVAAGPTLYNAQRSQTIANATECGGSAVEIFVEYYDPTGGMLTSANALRNTAPWQAVSGTDTAIAVRTPHTVCNNQAGTACEGISSTGTRGAFIMLLCRPSLNAETVAIYLRDTSDNYGNTFCVDLPAN